MLPWVKSNERAVEDAASGVTERRTRIDPRRERTRARLVEAATELVHRGGLLSIMYQRILGDDANNIAARRLGPIEP